MMNKGSVTGESSRKHSGERRVEAEIKIRKTLKSEEKTEASVPTLKNAQSR